MNDVELEMKCHELIGEQKYDLVKELCNIELKKNPKNTVAYKILVQTKLFLSDYLGVIADSTRAIEVDQNYSDAYDNRGAAKFYLNHDQYYKSAMEDWTKAIELDPNNDSAYYHRGNARLERGDYGGAIQDYTESIRIYSCSLYYEKRGLAKYKNGDFYGAIDDYSKYASDSDKVRLREFAVFRSMAEHTLAELTKRGYTEARPVIIKKYMDDRTKFPEPIDHLPTLDEFIKYLSSPNLEYLDNPTTARDHVLVADVIINYMDYIGAIEHLLKSNELKDPRSNFIEDEVFLLLGNIRSRLDDYEGAIECYNKRIERHSAPDLLECMSLVPYYKNRSKAMIQIKKYREAEHDLKKAIEIEPEQDTYVDLGAIKYELGDYEAASEYFSKAIELIHNRTLTDYDYGVYIMRAIAETIDKKYQNALSDLDIAASSKAHLSVSLVWKTYILKEMGKVEESEHYFSKTVAAIDQEFAQKDRSAESYLKKAGLYNFLGKIGHSAHILDEMLSLITSRSINLPESSADTLLRECIISEDAGLVDKAVNLIIERIANPAYLKKSMQLLNDFRSTRNAKVEKENFRNNLSNSSQIEYALKIVENSNAITKKDLKEPKEYSAITKALVDAANAKLKPILSKWDMDIEDVKRSNLIIEETVSEILKTASKPVSELIKVKRGTYKNIMRRVKANLGGQHELGKKEYNNVVKSIASAELLFNEFKGKGLDYSGIVILYCKAIEIMEYAMFINHKNRMIETLLRDYNPNMHYHEFVYNKESKNMQKWFYEKGYDNECEKMEKATRTGAIIKDGIEESIFNRYSAWKALGKLLKEGRRNDFRADLFAYNTYHFYFRIRGNLNETTQSIVKGVFEVYYKDRNGSAHTHMKVSRDAERVRQTLLGSKQPADFDKIENGLIYKMLHYLSPN